MKTKLVAIRVMKYLSAFAFLILISACSSWGVKPHERGLLAKESMQMGANAVEKGLDEHIYFSKEASSGGQGFGGGGCGCN